MDGERQYQILDSEKDGTLYEDSEPSEEKLKKLPEKVQEVIKQLKERKSFNWNNFEDLKKDKIRVFIPSGEEEA